MGVIRYKSTGDMQDSALASPIKRIMADSDDDYYEEHRGESSTSDDESPTEEEELSQQQHQQLQKQKQQQRDHNYQFGNFGFGGLGGDDEPRRRPLLGRRQRKEELRTKRLVAPNDRSKHQDKSETKQYKSEKLAKDDFWPALGWTDKADNDNAIEQKDPTSWRRSVSKPNLMNSKDDSKLLVNHQNHHHYQHHQLASIATPTKRVRQTNGARRRCIKAASNARMRQVKHNFPLERQPEQQASQAPEQQVNLSLSSPALAHSNGQDFSLQQVSGDADVDACKTKTTTHCLVDVGPLTTDHTSDWLLDRISAMDATLPTNRVDEEGQQQRRQANDNNRLANTELNTAAAAELEGNCKDNDNYHLDVDQVNQQGLSNCGQQLQSRQPVAGQWQSVEADTVEATVGQQQRLQSGAHCAPAQQQVANKSASCVEEAGRAIPTRLVAGKNLILPNSDSTRNPGEPEEVNNWTTTGKQAGNETNSQQQIQSQTLPGNHLSKTAQRLMGSMGYGGWHLALHSGSYKVAAHHQLPVSATNDQHAGNQMVQQQQQQQQQQRQQDNVKQVARQQQQQHRSVSRYSRPGRSPISLQRQTNARLARHKLKIQQQRQEQLVQLALRDRQHFSSGRYLGDSNELADYSQQATALSTLYTINGFIEQSNGLGVRRQDTPAQQQYQRSLELRNSHVNFSGPSCGIDRRHSQQLTVIEPAISRAVEICDNQLACSSRQLQVSSSTQIPLQRQQLQQHPRAEYNTNEAANVVVYRSIDMIRNSNDSHHLANDDKRSSKRSSKTSSFVNSDDIQNEDAQTICSSLASSTISLNKPFCKICHVGSSKAGDKLISPCRCSGTMQYIHCGCLLKWLEISNRTNEKPISCELCAHEYSWHKKFNYGHLRLPRCSLRDLFLHLIFILTFFVMVFSALAPMLYRKLSESTMTDQTTGYRMTEDELHGTRPTPATRTTLGTSPSGHIQTAGKLAHDEKFMLLCAASFFISFFLAIYVQTKARDTLYSLISKFLSMNQTYYITEYDHGQLNTNNINNNNGGNGINTAKSQYLDDPRLVRKNTQKS